MKLIGSAARIVTHAEIGSTAVAGPLLRRFSNSHAVAAILALLRLTAGDPPKRLTMLISPAT